MQRANDEHAEYLEEERDKLERWAEDTKQAMEQEIKVLEKEIIICSIAYAAICCKSSED